MQIHRCKKKQRSNVCVPTNISYTLSLALLFTKWAFDFKIRFARDKRGRQLKHYSIRTARGKQKYTSWIEKWYKFVQIIPPPPLLPYRSIWCSSRRVEYLILFRSYSQPTGLEDRIHHSPVTGCGQSLTHTATITYNHRKIRKGFNSRRGTSGARTDFRAW